MNMNSTERASGIVRWTLRLEQSAVLDRPVQAVEPTIQTVFGTGMRSSVLRGRWLGHAVHPALTDVVLGTWTSATLFEESRACKSSRVDGDGQAPPRR
jgi:hypothetical protein